MKTFKRYENRNVIRHSIGWRFGLVVTRWPRSTSLRYVRPG